MKAVAKAGHSKSSRPKGKVTRSTAPSKWRDLPFVLSKMSIEYFLKVYYSERRSRSGHLSKQQIGKLKKEYRDSSAILVGGLGGFLFGPDIEHNLLQIIGREVWTLGKGQKEGIARDPGGVMRCGSSEYHMGRWTSEVAIVLRRLCLMIESSSVLRESPHVVIIGHSSGGLINYTLGLLKTEGAQDFLKKHRKRFPGVAKLGLSRLETVQKFLLRAKLVAINTPFRGICQRLFGLGTKFIPPDVMSAIDEAFLNQFMRDSGKLPLDVIDLATHSVMTQSSGFRPRHIMSHALGSGLRFLSRIQQRGPNDGFVPLESAFLRSDLPHKLRDLDLGTRDHRDVIEHPDVIYRILKRLAKLDRERAHQQQDVLIGETWTDNDMLSDEFILQSSVNEVASGPDVNQNEEGHVSLMVEELPSAPQATIQKLVAPEMNLSTNQAPVSI